MLSCSEMRVLVATLLLRGVAISASNGLFEKALVFPSRSANSYVSLSPQKSLDLKAFTLCMNVAADIKGWKNVILFAYRTRECDELNIWRKTDGSYSLNLCTGEGFHPKINKEQVCWIFWFSLLVPEHTLTKISCSEMGVLVATFLLSGVALSASNGLFEKALVFPYQSANSPKRFILSVVTN
ncbi:hypothetical protein GJAV_G00219140 [Gymnothorax javanicus]|nr:hypothetical protein GJAV_G00219140 [Gymnothorax javanicus]